MRIINNFKHFKSLEDTLHAIHSPFSPKYKNAKYWRKIYHRFIFTTSIIINHNLNDQILRELKT